MSGVCKQGCITSAGCPSTAPLCAANACEVPTDCLALKTAFSAAPDGIYSISPVGGAPIAVYCEMTTSGGGWTQIAHVRREATSPYPGRQFLGTDPNALGYSIDATGIVFSEIAMTHNGLPAGQQFGSVTLSSAVTFDAALQDQVFTQSNGSFTILSLSAANSGGWGDIPLACMNSTSANCLFESRSIAHGAVASGGGNCQQLNTGTGVTAGCGGWGTAPGVGDTTWDGTGGRIFLR